MAFAIINHFKIILRNFLFPTLWLSIFLLSQLCFCNLLMLFLSDFFVHAGLYLFFGFAIFYHLYNSEYQLIIKVSVMYSKYVDYNDSAVKAHHTAQAENGQKDAVISQLKSEVYELRQLEGDFLRLNQLILGLEDKYSLLMDEKERSEKEQRIKTDIDKSSIIQLKEEIQALKVQLQKANIHIDELLRENSGMKRMSDARASEIHNIKYEIKGVENKNDRAHQENKDINANIKILKEQRMRLESQCQELDRILDSNVAKLKNLEKQVRNSQSTNARLDKTLHQAENDNGKLMTELKQKNDEAKRAENKLNSLHNTIEQLKITHENLINQSEKNQREAGNNAGNLSHQVNRGKQLSARLAGVEATIRAQQSELDGIINEEEKLRKQHYSGLEQNKELNNEIDRVLCLISEYQQVNRELIDEIQIYIDQDQQAYRILSRKQEMRQIIESTLRKIQVSSEPIRHIKY